jgi:methionyl-tRNA formyltransferase
MSQIWRLVLASTTPHPGAYTFHAGSKIKIWHATPASEDAQKGVVGRILQCDDEGRFVVQCGEGQLLVSKWESPDGWSPKTGARLGYYTEDEVYRLKKRVADIEEALAELRRKQMST